ncbi:MAG: MFS transporter [Pseudomonadota bacterium]
MTTSQLPISGRDRHALEGNLRRFIIFRLFYSARFYYPVLTILFLDYGLTLEQFALLNLAWALSIVVAEVPSGALADIVGRRHLVVFAAVMMVVEMSLLAFVPMGASGLLFTVFLINRISSGLSEAAASGADEALAYDSLKALGREEQWSHLLEKTSRVVSIGFFVTMILGAFVYDQALLNRTLAFINPDWQVARETAIRLPVLLTLLSAFVVLATALGFRELPTDPVPQRPAGRGGLVALLEAFRQVGRAGQWILGHRFVLFVILAALALDSVARQFVVLASEYYRLIDIPVSWFGLIGAGMSLFGIVTARFSRYLVNSHTPAFNFGVLSSVLLLSLLGLTLAIPVGGLLFAVGAFALLGMVQFQASFYLNRAVDSSLRATVLSFKGLALNLGLGFASLLYTGLVATLRAREGSLAESELQKHVFLDALLAFPLYYIVLMTLIILAARKESGLWKR